MANFNITGFILNMVKITSIHNNYFIKKTKHITKELQKNEENKQKSLPKTTFCKDLICSTRQPAFTKVFTINYQKTINTLLNDHLNKIDLTKKLSKSNKQKFLSNLKGDEGSFCDFILGDKPSILLNGKHEYLTPTDKYDIIRRKIKVVTPKKTYTFDNTFILNKEKTKHTINKNRDLYMQRLNLKEDCSTNDIYDILTSKNSPLLTNDKHDIIGITLGFSPINSIIFQLEQSANYTRPDNKNLNSYKKLLLNTLHSEDSPYQNFSPEFMSKIAHAIRDIRIIPNSENNTFAPFGYTYVNIINDDTYNQRIVRSILKTYNRAKSLVDG